MALKIHDWAVAYVDGLIEDIGLDPNVNQRTALHMVASETGTDPYFKQTDVYVQMENRRLDKVYVAINRLARYREGERRDWMQAAAALFAKPVTPDKPAPRPIPPKPPAPPADSPESLIQFWPWAVGMLLVGLMGWALFG